jgi:3-oxoacyl-[acyl-carrier-protein] synthase II
MPERRVVITGIGAVSALGLGAEDYWQRLLAGETGLGAIELFDASRFPCSIAGEVRDFKARNYVPKSYRKAVKVMARDIELAVAAADLAFRDANLASRGIDEGDDPCTPKRLGCNIGAGLICSDLDELGMAVNTAVKDGQFDLKLWGEQGINNLTPLWLLKYLPNMLSCHVTIIHGCEGPSNCITCSDASGQMAVAEAARYIARNVADVSIAGGAETKLNPMGLLRQHLLKRLNASADDPAAACKPFDAAHGGTVVGEGGALLILEDLERARARGARIYAEVVGFGGACDPAGMDVTKPNCGSLDLAVKRSLKDAGIEPGHVGALFAHGTGVATEDEMEAAAWLQALENLPKVPAASITGATGSLFAGAGALEVATAALSLHHQRIPPTAGFEAPASGCRLNLSNVAREHEFEYAVSAAFGVGGQSGAICLKRFQA